LEKKVDVLLVDDSAVVRGLFKKLLESDSDIRVVGAVTNGLNAIEYFRTADADVVLLDLEMPKMDGLTALPKLLKIKPTLKVIIVSSLSTHGSRQTLNALELGALDYLPKPTASTALSQLKDDLILKIKTLYGISESKVKSSVSQMPQARALSRPNPEIIVIGSSTGGPNALNEFFSALPISCDLPILVVQHIPKNFSDALAERISVAAKRPCFVAKEGMNIERGNIYLAPGDYHMYAVKSGESIKLKLDQAPEVNYCRPAVDPMFQSTSRIYGAKTLGIVFTGMGSDGAKGALEVKNSGGIVIAQDEESSVVWGMPGAVVNEKAADYILPLNKIAEATSVLCKERANKWAS